MLKKFHFFPNLPQINISASSFENESLYLQELGLIHKRKRSMETKDLS
ncbi:hypothetical protein BSUW23_19080 [Bacillus spizizenii str. W23]|uniref:Uncharacterized protein n=2 Tax=Bacillus spizizenii TaxID=96241 RepID=E0TWR4_BACSH|nr:hypothetical protein BSUW23_19080 [Bacillus spizizenii str. W23]